ncbi:hypothetical protein [Psychrobium sp. 1_MG-2023]|uniref:hypothetical protein n=1 Tax=Psychrobium sp. 1_MG-2023 TaxID=3062624 RepID=UPI000C335D8A|nr:hypothetical protein [Psychrobium sp. 1_MG-2023]MDP2562793.1 hypothetical protein [Psychrobium sp. 1_MG-2023]PKF54458.1 hypothetical protein CW748_15930 [Alteromonadales bacterium alter-6D02]
MNSRSVLKPLATLITTYFLALPLHANILIHTDNTHDYNSLIKLKPLGISAETQFHVLDLPKSNIQLELVPYKRTLKSLDTDTPTCVLSRLKTKQRKEKYLFSQPLNLFFSRRLYQSSTLMPLSNEPVDLINLFHQHPQRTMVISDQFSYGDALDRLIRQLPKKNLVNRDGTNHAPGLLEMFFQKRVDYALLNPNELYGHYLELNKQSYEIKGIPPFILGHIMCNNRPQTRSFIDNINIKIQQLIDSGVLYQLHIKHLPKSQHAIFQRYYQRVFQ